MKRKILSTVILMIGVAVISGILSWVLWQSSSSAQTPKVEIAQDTHTKEHQGEEKELHREDEAPNALHLSPSERTEKGIRVEPLRKRALVDEIVVPGEITLNQYRTSQVTSRISAQVVARHAVLGQQVRKGDRLLTLSSVEMAKAQGELRVADREWQRLKSLGRDIVSERRYTEAEVAQQLAFAKVLAFGMTEAQARTLLREESASKATGEFDLLALQDGIITRDNFVLGEVVEPGRVLMEVRDETIIWVKAQLSTEQATRIATDDTARISLDGETFEGRILQIGRNVDETTRTLPVRIEVKNPARRLVAGDFVRVTISMGTEEETLAVPEGAIVLMEGVASVFRVEGEEVRPVAVVLGPTREGWAEVQSGLHEGDAIVVEGVFLLKSLLLKSRMGEGHVH